MRKPPTAIALLREIIVQPRRAVTVTQDDGVVNVASLLDRSGGRFADLLEAPVPAEAISALRAAETIGRPLGSASFRDRLTAATGRDPRPKRRGPKPKGAVGVA